MARVDVEVAQEWEHNISAIGTGDVPAQQIDHAGIAAETCRVANHSSPIIVVIEETGILTGGGKPELQLAFEAVQQVVESVRVLLLSYGKELGDSSHLLATEIRVSGSVVISLVDDAIKQPLQRRGVVVRRPRQIWQDAIECVRGRE